MKDPTMLQRKPRQDPVVREFFKAVRTRDHKKVRLMLKNKTIQDPDVRDMDDPLRPTALLVASEMDDDETAWLLLKPKNKPADVNAETVRGRRAIWWAAKHGSEKLADVLLRKPGCEVNELDKETGSAPLFRAIISNADAVVQLLIHHGADVNMRRLGFGVGAETPLIKAVQLNNKAICEALINALCNIQARTDNNLNALHYAVAYRRYDICEVLLENQIKIHAKSTHGVTPMAIAIEHHNAAMVKILIQHGYKIDKKYKWKETPLEQAIKLHSEACAITLVHSGCSIDTLRGKPSYFYMALNEKLFSLVKLLVDIRPSFLSERWIWSRQWPVAIFQMPEVCAWLTNESRKPRSLKTICRGKIFKILGRSPSSKSDKLPIPDGLKEFLKYNHHITDKFYCRIPLDIQECPFDCPSSCPIKYCPPLDISSSDSDEIEF
ncbi:serine/threonine-protein phosphatase 6 regulatory ankyrin repeat subunit A-like [Haliotis asinina]|uniref:serine/threonine-protein phosphatase 6 regulatory ankyrin repeat subunit A-like n=1 Tax=Haliotis asinina TaxID=109174 RepID=UPI003531E070